MIVIDQSVLIGFKFGFWFGAIFGVISMCVIVYFILRGNDK